MGLTGAGPLDVVVELFADVVSLLVLGDDAVPVHGHWATAGGAMQFTMDADNVTNTANAPIWLFIVSSFIDLVCSPAST